ncbi:MULTISPECIES: RnfABCDGE type electron transport complex subunit B [Eubacterium]|uniref:Ion-translocating oxidoreductase complex subunit B n=1 Tax=Eubacterium ruminantium TaxID=42322 RepID=A0A1T4PJP3_9FIRM|nr:MULTISPECIES: RnfABCDGE type electron transport complex subunit B [Eubacterium]MCR5367346.1 RnfABCDGE type electron transport complex subunit B [Eubacterium sp.]SCW60237.1 electron transport complex, RnfABCDGE type, B subunit [Eubacterium ruminantium]SDN11617.1 electron transport complex, RnfABCDGE type, B subunit [Eubacterium ruminantium]SJZ91446.1 electron transport complex, RnfABCDGE type, B subunit [Eubacterium ruminantium]
MNYIHILIAAGIIAGVAILVGILLGKASEIFKVETSETEAAVREALPGNNCGACGFPGCDGLAKAIAEGKAPVNSCPVGGDAVAEKISKIVGGEVGQSVKMVAVVKCKGDCNKAKELYNYVGPKTCIIASNAPNKGPKACTYGCLGYGECKKVCEFGAIDIVDGVAVIDKDKCKACMKCVEICPRHLIKMIPYNKTHIIMCNNKDRGLDVKDVCSAGCIGCTLCVKSCPKEAIEMNGNLPKIDYEKCVNCGLCEKKCPMKAIS